MTWNGLDLGTDYSMRRWLGEDRKCGPAGERFGPYPTAGIAPGGTDILTDRLGHLSPPWRKETCEEREERLCGVGTWIIGNDHWEVTWQDGTLESDDRVYRRTSTWLLEEKGSVACVYALDDCA